MKLKIEKLEHGPIRVEMAADTSKKPIVFEIAPQQVPMLVTLLQTAMKADKLTFQLEL